MNNEQLFILFLFLEIETKKQCHLLLQQQQKNKVPKTKFNQGGKRPIFRKLNKPMKKEVKEYK